MAVVSSLFTWPLSQRSPLSSFRMASLPATRTWYPVCRWPRSAEVTIQLNRGRETSMPSGSARYSHRNSAGLSPNPDSRNVSARSDDVAAAATIRQISKIPNCWNPIGNTWLLIMVRLSLSLLNYGGLKRESGKLRFVGLSARVRIPASVCSRRGQRVAVADDHGRSDEHEQCESDETPGVSAGSRPFPQRDSPEGAEDHDAGHVQGPARELEPSHLSLAHGVEEKLEVPGRARQSAEDIIPEQWDTPRVIIFLLPRGTLDDLLAGCVDGRLDYGLFLTSRRPAADGAEILVSRLVLQMQDHAPDKVCCEPAQEQYDQDRQSALARESS